MELVVAKKSLPVLKGFFYRYKFCLFINSEPALVNFAGKRSNVLTASDTNIALGRPCKKTKFYTLLKFSTLATIPTIFRRSRVFIWQLRLPV